MIDLALARYGLPAESLEIVDDVHEWCKREGVIDDHPFRVAKCFVLRDQFHIAITAVHTDDVIAGVKGGMLFDGFAVEVATLCTDELYLAHLVLHEVAMYVLRDPSQAVRDRWAFSELPRLQEVL